MLITEKYFSKFILSGGEAGVWTVFTPRVGEYHLAGGTPPLPIENESPNMRFVLDGIPHSDIVTVSLNPILSNKNKHLFIHKGNLLKRLYTFVSPCCVNLHSNKVFE